MCHVNLIPVNPIKEQKRGRIRRADVAVHKIVIIFVEKAAESTPVTPIAEGLFAGIGDKCHVRQPAYAQAFVQAVNAAPEIHGIPGRSNGRRGPQRGKRRLEGAVSKGIVAGRSHIQRLAPQNGRRKEHYDRR